MASAPGHVAICGAGPAGALLAFLLARGGVRVTLIERHTDFSREFRGEGMSPAGMAAIREAGLWDDFDRLPASKLTSMAMYADGRQFIEVEIERAMPADMSFVRILSQHRLLEMLVAKAAAFDAFELLRGAVVQDVVRDAAGRARGVKLAQGGAEREIACDYVVAADGRYSVLRKRLGAALGGRQQVFDVVWCRVPRPEMVPKGRGFGFLLGQFFGLMFPTENDCLQVGRVIPKGTYREFRDPSEGDWYGNILEMLPPDLRPLFAALREQSSDPALLDVICGSMDQWSAPGVAFVGDAAHPMSPIGAQGINIALRDAVIAANHLGPALLAGDAEALDAAAAAFEAERRPEVGKIQEQQNDAPKLYPRLRAAAPFPRTIPTSWITGLVRFAMGLRATRNFVEGASKIELTFGKMP